MDVGNTCECGNRTGYPSNLAEPIDITSNSLVAPTRFEPALSCHPGDRAGPVRGQQASGPRELTQEVEWAGDGVVTKATRQRFTMGYKRKIVREADACKKPDAVWALLRREELYFFH